MYCTKKINKKEGDEGERKGLRLYTYFQLSKIPDSFHRSQSKPTPTEALGSPLISRISNNSYSLPKARKCAKNELK
jgi:hypothetical protein